MSLQKVETIDGHVSFIETSFISRIDMRNLTIHLVGAESIKVNPDSLDELLKLLTLVKHEPLKFSAPPFVIEETRGPFEMDGSSAGPVLPPSRPTRTSKKT